MTFVTKMFAPRVLALTGGSLLIAASAALGAYYGFTVGAHVHVLLGAVFAAAALGGEILKPLAVLSAIDGVRNWRFAQGALCACLAAVLIVYSFTAELGLAATSRSDLEAKRAHAAGQLSIERDRQARALADLNRLEPARPVSELHALANQLRMTPGANGCTRAPNGPISRRVCGEVEALMAEAARAKRRTELEAAVASSAERLRHASSVTGHANPLAAALSAYATRAGMLTSPEAIAPWLALIPVLLLELGSALSLVVVRQFSPEDTGPAPSRPTHGQPDTDRTGDDVDEDDTPGPLGSKVIELISGAGGALKGGQRGIAQALGVSKTRLNEILHELATAGRILLDTAPTGTTIRLAAA